MRCILMNKNTPVMLLDFNAISNSIDDICEVYNIAYAPLAIINANHKKKINILKQLNEWFKGRGIPSWRKDLKKLLEKLNVSSQEELLNKAYALSLSDQYWLKEEGSQMEWKDINFFTNDFEYEAYLEASLDSFSSAIRSTDKNILQSPNNTTDGMLQKGWIIEDGNRVLVKGTYTPSKEEPINEWLASQISRRFCFDYCDYSVEWNENTKLISKCNNFINENEEIISAYDIFNSEKKPNHMNDYDFYVSILEKHHIPNVRINMENMFVIDYLIMNTDRHLKNFGVIRNVNSLEWVRLTPIFDNGQSMQCEELTENMNFRNGKGKFFTDTAKDYEKIIQTLGDDIKRLDVHCLDGLCEEYKSVLLKYQDKIRLSDMRIEKLLEGLEYRIKRLGEYIESL